MYYKTAKLISNASFVLLVLVFSCSVGFWLILNFDSAAFSPFIVNFFADFYGIVALFGFICGLEAVYLWGGYKSILGKSLLLFSIGLFFQLLGQLTYAIYRNFFGIENPYPSFAEVFYFGSIPIYIYAIYLLAKVSGLGFSLKRVRYKVFSIVVPILMLLFSYILFLKGYDYSLGGLATFLDYGYPILQAIQISFAIITYSLVRNVSGGKFKYPIILVLIALCVQYIADTVYTYKVIEDTWKPAGYSDLLYLISYFLMGFALYQFVRVYRLTSNNLDNSKISKNG